MFRSLNRQSHFSMAASSPLQSAHRQKLGSAFTLSGCRPFPLSAAEMADYDGRYEYWEAGIAWELRDVSPKHERPSVRLAELVADIAKMRGTPIEMFRTADLQERGGGGTRIRAAQAGRAGLPRLPLRCPERVRGRRTSPARRGVRGGPDHRHPRPQARRLRRLGRSGAVGRGARRRSAEQAQATGLDDPSPRQRYLPGVRRERGVPHLVGAGDPRRAERVRACPQRPWTPCAESAGSWAGTPEPGRRTTHS